MSNHTKNTERPHLTAELAPLNWENAHRTTIQMRYSDTDAMGHLNNAVYVQYLETSRVLLMRDLAVPDGGGRSVVARLELEYRQEIKLGQTVVVESLVEHIGRSSWTVVSRILADGQPSAFARTVEVKVGEDMRPAAIDDALRTLFEPLMTKEVQA